MTLITKIAKIYYAQLKVTLRYILCYTETVYRVVQRLYKYRRNILILVHEVYRDYTELYSDSMLVN